MTSSSAWADYLDARLRLVREWDDAGHSPIEIAERLTPSAVDIVKLLETPTEPPIPGCSRDRVRFLTDRIERLTTELANRGEVFSTLPPQMPTHSQIRSLALDPDPAACGCQYWVERPRPGEHHPECAHFPRPM